MNYTGIEDFEELYSEKTDFGPEDFESLEIRPEDGDYNERLKKIRSKRWMIPLAIILLGGLVMTECIDYYSYRKSDYDFPEKSENAYVLNDVCYTY